MVHIYSSTEPFQKNVCQKSVFIKGNKSFKRCFPNLLVEGRIKPHIKTVLEKSYYTTKSPVRQLSKIHSTTTIFSFLNTISVKHFFNHAIKPLLLNMLPLKSGS